MLGSRHVVLRCARPLVVAGVLVWSTASLALGLGDITVHSGLDQPFKADIALLDVGGLSQSELSVSLATADEFSRAGVERVFFLNDLRFTPILRGERKLIRVTSGKPVNEPFLNFLVQVNQPNGRLLREYTVLIDPPGSPGIVPATDEPDVRAQDSGFPTPEAPAPTAPGKPAAQPAASAPATPAAPANDALAEQLAASVLQNQQLQKSLDELNARLQAQDVQIADGKKQVSDLQSRLTELQQAPPPPVAAPAPAPVAAPVEPREASSDWPLYGGLLVLFVALVAGLFVLRRRRQTTQTQAARPAPALRNEPQVEGAGTSPLAAVHHAAEHREESGAGQVLEAVGIYLAYGRLGEAAGLLRDALGKEPERTDLGLQLLEVLGRQGDGAAYDEQESHLRGQGVTETALQEIRSRCPKLAPVAPLLPVLPVTAAAPLVTAAPPVASEDSFELNDGDLSMDSSWDLNDERPADALAQEVSALGDSLEILPQDFELPQDAEAEAAELEWIAEPQEPTLDEDFLNAFGDPGKPPGPQAGAGKLEQAQTCIDDGDIDSAIALLNELLKEGDEPLRQTARTLLAGIR
ncbi:MULTISPECIES: FimV/HubP family polar landmark protein [unclassified Pseudomonas]|uniref:FimV/HubP family polar landmark protein n=1 Tax=unclassified Pseudomonas TaxID=196821 RepID=UPI000A1F0069|nr:MULTISPECIES: FimV/HubP family polar landmark protein [unclassified Pseudomonas]